MSACFIAPSRQALRRHIDILALCAKYGLRLCGRRTRQHRNQTLTCPSRRASCSPAPSSCSRPRSSSPQRSTLTLLYLPSKPEILALPPAGQRAVVRQAQPGLMLLGLMVAGVSAYLQYAAWNVAHGRSAGGLGSLVIVVPLVSVALMPTILFPVRRELRRQQAMLD